MINFIFEKSKNFIQRTDFFEPNLNQNILNIKYDNQGNYWTHLERKNIINNYILSNPPYRNIPNISQQEKLKRNLFQKNIKKDIFYQFKQTYKNIPTHINHFQVRKNLQKINNYLIYTKEYGIEIFDNISKINQGLIYFDENESNQIICFAIEKINNNFYLCIGKVDTTCILYEINYNDFIQKRNYKNNSFIPKNKKILTLTDSYSDNYINYIKFLPDNKLLRTGNDSFLKIYDLNQNNKIIYELLNDSPINHCDINYNKNIIISVGDSINVDLFDLKSKKNIIKLVEHYDYGIVCKFNPYNDNYFVSGNQDSSCKIWDIRNLNCSVETLFGKYESIGDLIWMKNNKIAFIENIFFGHVYDTKKKCIQDFEFFGLFNGIEYDEIKDIFYIAIQNDNNGDIICYEKIKGNKNSFYNILL